MTSFDLRVSAIQFAVVVALVTAGAIGCMVLLDPRAQAFWGARFSELGTAARLLADGIAQAVETLPYPGKP